MKQFFLTIIGLTAFWSCSSDDNPINEEPKPISEAVVLASTGGPNQQNQVFIKLNTNTKSEAKRDDWDLRFFCGSEFRVGINGSIQMAVKQLNTTNIDEVQSADATVAVSLETLASLGYVDNPTGILTGSGSGVGTAIAEISANASENKVYLVNLGFRTGTTTPSPGSIALNGDARGWKKIRISREGSGYKLQYADLNATTHQTVTITKDANYNFKFFNLITNQEITAEPKKQLWDLCFTTFTNYFPVGPNQVTYFFSDFVTSNLYGGTKVYQVMNTEFSYDAFMKVNIDNSKFTPSETDQRAIGSNWRSGGGPNSGPSIRDDRFYVLKDSQGNLYKIKFLALTNDANQRGHAAFEFKILE